MRLVYDVPKRRDPAYKCRLDLVKCPFFHTMKSETAKQLVGSDKVSGE